MMRPLLLSFLVATSFVALAPLAEARADACTSLTSATCPGLLCQDKNGDGRFDSWECSVGDSCDFQSDCCRSYPANGFWCPEDS